MDEDQNIERSQQDYKTESSKEVNENISQEQPIEITESLNPTSEISTSEIKNMEVYHHPDLHHRRKHFKEYFLEFLMIFLAVTLGFFAESYREYLSDNAKEKEYIRSFIQDLKTDTTNLNQSLLYNSERIPGMEALTELIWNSQVTKAEARQLYELKFAYTGRFKKVFFSKNAITQLKYSGGLRLIHNVAVADSILNYDLSCDLTDQEAQVIMDYLTDNFKAEYEIFNDKFSPWNPDVDSTKYVHQNFDLLTYDTKVLTAYAGRIAHQSAAMKNYCDYFIPAQKQRAKNLLIYLKNEYHLENE